MRNDNRRGVLMSLPLFLFTIVFVAAPLIYMVALSLATNNEGYGEMCIRDRSWLRKFGKRVNKSHG